MGINAAIVKSVNAFVEIDKAQNFHRKRKEMQYNNLTHSKNVLSS